MNTKFGILIFSIPSFSFNNCINSGTHPATKTAEVVSVTLYLVPINTFFVHALLALAALLLP